jgi:transposase
MTVVKRFSDEIGGEDGQALFDRPARAGVAGWGSWSVSSSGRARRFGVGLSTVYLWRQQARAEGRRCAKPHAGGRTLGIDAAGEAILRALVSERNDRTLDEYREQLAARTGRPRVSRPTLCRALRRFGLWRKKRRCAPASRIAPTSKRNGRSFASGSGRSSPRTWSLSTKPASPRR